MLDFYRRFVKIFQNSYFANPTKYRFDGVQCHACGRIYTLDLYVDDRVWQIIPPNVRTEGLLCPACIGDRLERAFREGRLKDVTHGVIELRK